MSTLSDLRGTSWAGSSELWLDPAGDEVDRGECTISIDDDGISYRWAREGKDHSGRLAIREGGVEFSDTWHSPEPMSCADVPNGRAMLCVEGTYGPDKDWGWRTIVSLRGPSGELVLQMTNIAPWGEEARAVRMICKRT